MTFISMCLSSTSSETGLFHFHSRSMASRCSSVMRLTSYYLYSTSVHSSAFPPFMTAKMGSQSFLRLSLVLAELRLKAFLSSMPVFQQCLAEKQLATIAYRLRLFSRRSGSSAKKSCTQTFLHWCSCRNSTIASVSAFSPSNCTFREASISCPPSPHAAPLLGRCTSLCGLGSSPSQLYFNCSATLFRSDSCTARSQLSGSTSSYSSYYSERSPCCPRAGGERPAGGYSARETPLAVLRMVLAKKQASLLKPASILKLYLRRRRRTGKGKDQIMQRHSKLQQAIIQSIHQQQYYEFQSQLTSPEQIPTPPFGRKKGQITFTIKIHKQGLSAISQQKLQINNCKTGMENLDRTEYLSKIEEIRMRIQSKQPSVRENKSRGLQQQSGQNSLRGLRIDPMSIVDDLSKRRPLESAENKANQFHERVKELDSVSERIKVLLSTKRTPSNHTENTPRPSLPLSNIAAPPKNEKLTSLFQKDLHFAESKVGESAFGDFRSRDLGINFKERLSTPIREVYEPSPPSILPQISQRSSSSEESQVRPETSIAQQSGPAFDMESFKQRFMKQIAKESSKEQFSDLPPQAFTTPITNRQRSEVSSTKRQSITSRATCPASFPQTQKLLDVLWRQIELQGKLRASKEKLDAFRAENKMGLLREQLSRRRIVLSEREMDEWVRIEQEQFDPFLSLVFTREFDFGELIGHLQQAKSHWEERVRGSVSLQELQREQFKIRQAESFRRGCIYLQDLVCFVNLKFNSCLKNRDLFSLFKHLMLLECPQIAPEHKIRNETFFGFVAR